MEIVRIIEISFRMGVDNEDALRENGYVNDPSVGTNNNVIIYLNSDEDWVAAVTNKDGSYQELIDSGNDISSALYANGDAFGIGNSMLGAILKCATDPVEIEDFKNVSDVIMNEGKDYSGEINLDEVTEISENLDNIVFVFKQVSILEEPVTGNFSSIRGDGGIDQSIHSDVEYSDGEELAAALFGLA
ncbi:uncharacterized protein METZ01_LOCUS450495 [marine metagenome]|uniref:Uncharacterized protein n=1 Tax=marine metagenome TaxID=408172 RepID=A0A382ZQ95_9ZZZZ